MTVNTTTGEIATVDTSSEVAVTGYLQHARDWLATAVESTGPEQIAAAKAEIATAAEATKQLGLSKEIQTDAQEMVRRAEYALGKAIRKGQEEGGVRVTGTAGPMPDYIRNGRLVRGSERGADRSPTAISPTEFFSNPQARSETYQMSDDVTPEQFEDAITKAKAEGNLSRANVIRKVKGYVSGDLTTRDQRAEAIRDLADKGWASRQMTDRIGITEESIRLIARDYGIPIPADRTLHRQRRVNSNDIVDNLVIGLEGSAMSLDLVDPTDLDRELAQYWATSLTESLQKLNRFAKQIKEIAQ